MCIRDSTKIEFLQRDLKVSRLTATRYLDVLTADGFLHKRKVGRSNYYINIPLFHILAGEPEISQPQIASSRQN